MTSSACRAILCIISEQSNPERQAKKQRTYFLWDYDLSEEEVFAILRGENEVEKAWLITRILE